MSVQSFLFDGDVIKDFSFLESREWLLSNGLGSYSSGTLAGSLSRKYHGLLVARLSESFERYVVLTKLEERVKLAGEIFELSSNRWSNDVIAPKGYQYLKQFKLEGSTPVWIYELPVSSSELDVEEPEETIASALEAYEKSEKNLSLENKSAEVILEDEEKLQKQSEKKVIVEKRIWMEEGQNTVYINYYYSEGEEELELEIDSFINNRSFHSLNTKDSSFSCEVVSEGLEINLHNQEIPKSLKLFCEGAKFDIHKPCWFENYDLIRERERCYEANDNNFKVATFTKRLKPNSSITVTASLEDLVGAKGVDAYQDKLELEIDFVNNSWTTQNKQPAWLRYLDLASRHLIVKKDLSDDYPEKTVLNGYPWYGEQTKELLISVNGLTLNEPELTREILSEVSKYFNRGSLPSELNLSKECSSSCKVDCSLWFFYALDIYLKRTNDLELVRELFIKLDEVINSLIVGDDGLSPKLYDPIDGLLCLDDLSQGKGKAVGVNALWYNALKCMASWSKDLDLNANQEYYSGIAAKVRATFSKFINYKENCLFSVIEKNVEGNHLYDSTMKPEQILSISLSHSPLLANFKIQLLETCKKKFLTPSGFRSLPPDAIGYKGCYLQDNIEDREFSGENGCLNLWLMAHFARAHFNTHNDFKIAFQTFDSMPQLMEGYGIGLLGEFFDGDFPYKPGGAILHAASVGETLLSCYLLTRSLPVLVDQKEILNI
ncbi:MAG TPA: glycogen debranching enzyme N-terminal domain-containing protein [Vampirovibrionales bacterium]